MRLVERWLRLKGVAGLGEGAIVGVSAGFKVRLGLEGAVGAEGGGWLG